MIKAVVLRHPQSANLLNVKSAFRAADAAGSPLVSATSISCGTSSVADCDLSEAGDFCPTFASWNGALFETSVILTVWKHAARFLGDSDVAFLHSDVTINRSPQRTWAAVADSLKGSPGRSVALTAPSRMKAVWRGDEVPNFAPLTPAQDPMRTHRFEHGVDVWDMILKYDPDLYDWGLSTQPRMIYAHQFACSRATLDSLGSHLYEVASKVTLRDCGLWTPHMFERIIGMYLVKLGGPAVHSTAFWHHHTSGSYGDGLKLYGHRAYRYWLADGLNDEVEDRRL